MIFVKALFIQWGLLSTFLVFIQTVVIIVALVSPLRQSTLRWVIATGFLFIADCVSRFFYVLTSSYGPEFQRWLMIMDLLRCILFAMVIPGVFCGLLLIKSAITSPSPWRASLIAIASISFLAVGVIVTALLLATMGT